MRVPIPWVWINGGNGLSWTLLISVRTQHVTILSTKCICSGGILYSSPCLHWPMKRGPPTLNLAALCLWSVAKTQMDCSVFPRPMSSHRMPWSLYLLRKPSQLTPSWEPGTLRDWQYEISTRHEQFLHTRLIIWQSLLSNNHCYRELEFSSLAVYNICCVVLWRKILM